MAEPTLAPNAYQKAFINTSTPRATFSTLQARLTAAQKTNDTLADVFKERVAIEQAYVASLQKLASKRGQGGGVIRDGLGAFAGVWEKVWNEVNETAATHAGIERKMKEEVETPLRRLSGKGDWATLQLFENNFDRTIKNLENAQSRLTKAQKKVESSRKDKAVAELQAAQTAQADAQEGYIVESPQVFALYQSIDQQRLAEMKQIFIRWETSRADAAKAEMDASARTIEALLGWDILEDLQEFILRKGSGGGGGIPRVSQLPSSASAIAAPVPPPAQPNGLRHASSASVMSRATTITRRQSTSSSSGPISGGNGSEFGSGGGSSGLKPLKSVFGRNKNRDRSSSNATSRSGSGSIQRPPGPSADTDSATNGGFSSLNDRQDYDDVYNQDHRSSRMPGGGSSVELAPPIMPMTVGTSSRNNNGLAPIPQSGAHTPTVDAEGYSVPPPDHAQAPWEQQQPPAGGATSLGDDDDDDVVHSLATPVPDSQFKLSLAPAPIEESDEARAAALAKVQGALLAQPPSAGPTRRGTIARGRRDVRNTTFGMIPDDMPLGQAFGLGAGAGLSLSTAGSTAARNPSRSSTFDTSSLPPAPASPALGPGSGSMVVPSIPTRSSTMMSSVSTHSNSSNIHNPFGSGAATPPVPAIATGSGLRAAITETCNVVSRTGTIVKAMIAGEIAVSLKDVPLAAVQSNGPLRLRIDCFEQLEKVAPNPQFVRPATTQPGEYLLDAVALASARSDKPIVLFKYQLHIGEGKAGQLVPLTAVPQWKCEEDATKLMINYTITPTCSLLTAAAPPSASPFDEHSVTSSSPVLTDIAFSVPISSASISKPQSKPYPGTYDPTTKRITYLVDPLSPSGEREGKLVAKMNVEGGPSVPAPIGVRWAIRGALCSGLGVTVLGGQVAAGEVEEQPQAAWQIEEVAKAIQSGKFSIE